MTSTADQARFHRLAGTAAEPPWSLVITPETAGWGFSGLRTADLDAGGSVVFSSGPDEIILLPIAGSFEVRADGRRFELTGRLDVWSGASDFIYVPPGTSIAISSAAGGRIAVPGARAERRRPIRHVPAAAVAVELRGHGANSREVRNFAAADAFDAERLIAVEVLVPGGNWSSYPPHKHDEARAEETALEEIYWYQLADGPGGPGLAYQQVYGTPDRPIDVLAQVHSGDVVLIPHGYHGPSMAAPGYDLYYLNVMAGPGERAWRAFDDPAHGWVRDATASQPIDPRLPFGRR